MCMLLLKWWIKYDSFLPCSRNMFTEREKKLLCVCKELNGKRIRKTNAVIFKGKNRRCQKLNLLIAKQGEICLKCMADLSCKA